MLAEELADVGSNKAEILCFFVSVLYLSDFSTSILCSTFVQENALYTSCTSYTKWLNNFDYFLPEYFSFVVIFYTNISLQYRMGILPLSVITRHLHSEM